MAKQPQDGSNVRHSRVREHQRMSSRRARSGASLLPCGACKHTKRKCISGCIFAPYFSLDQGQEQFAIVHDILGSRNLAKMLNRVEVNHRHEVVASILYEARARLADPVHGCLSVIHTLEQQVASLKRELANAMVQNQLINTRTSYATFLHGIQQQQQQLQPSQPNINLAMQPPYFNNSSLHSNFMNLNSFNPSFNHLAMQTTPSIHCLEPLQFSELPQHEEESMIPQIFNNDINPLFQPPYYNNSSLYNNFTNTSSFNSSCDHLTMQTTPSTQRAWILFHCLG